LRFNSSQLGLPSSTEVLAFPIQRKKEAVTIQEEAEKFWSIFPPEQAGD
jgi:hypothetical protein